MCQVLAFELPALPFSMLLTCLLACCYNIRQSFALPTLELSQLTWIPVTCPHALRVSCQAHKASKHAGAGSDDDDEHHHHDGCDEDCAHGGHSLSSGAGAASRPNPVAAMPGLVFEPKVAKSVVAFMAADSPAKVRELPPYP